jgi:glucan 1,3-beta-glucosidase
MHCSCLKLVLTTRPACSAAGGLDCQNSIFSLEGTLSNINVYTLNTVGTTNMITSNGVSLAKLSDNVNAFEDTIALFQLAASSGGTTPPTKTAVPTTMSTATTAKPTGTAGPAGWTFLGCYTDSVSSRSLPIGIAAGGAAAMTVESCTAGCHAAGYVLAGLEYAGECCKCFFPLFPLSADGC